MKRFAFLLLIVPFFGQAHPERILPKTLVLKPAVWYRQQADAWSNELKSNHSAEAWFNYYAASYFSQEAQMNLNQIVNAMAKEAGNSYEYLLVKGWNEGFKPEAFVSVKKAYDLHPEKSEALGLMQLFSEMNFETSNRTSFSEQLLKQSQVSPSLLSYSYNVLMSVEPSAVLITEGESTTTPLFILQDVMKMRNDVNVLSLDLLSNQTYLENKLKSLGLQLNGPMETANIRNAICSLLPLQNNGRKFYYALTLSKDNLSSLKENLYVVGLASLHSLNNIDNVATIKKNFEKQFLLDYLKVDFNGESRDATGKVFSANYLVPMILLYESYLKENKLTEASALRELMEQVARTSGKEELISNYLGAMPGDVIPYFPTSFDAKSFDGKLRPITENKLYAENTEVTNEQYNIFLGYLKSHSLDDLLEKYKFDLSSYTEPALSFMKGYSMPIPTTKKNKFFTQYPAVSMTYEAANAYCEWLTEQYNHAAEKKFKKVKFRLPTISEWQIAALGFKNFTSWNLDENTLTVGVPADSTMEFSAKGKTMKVSAKDVSYPWWGAHNYRNKVQNRKNCFLANIRVPENCKPCAMPHIAGDGFTMMSFVGAYFPNNIGLYDVVGNVAEMTSEKGKACGGSWNHLPNESTIRSVNNYDKAQSDIGFRVFMEVIEK